MSEIYWIQWLRYNQREDGCCTHAVPESGNGKALCGVRPTETAGGVVAKDGEPTCIKCRASLVKLGIIIGRLAN